MDKIKKALKKFTEKEKKIVKNILGKISERDFNNLDIKKLKNREDIFRIRKGKIRIVYIIKNNNIKILLIERRNDKTYNF